MGKDGGMGFCVREVEASAERVAKFMMDGHSNTTETGSAEPGTIQGR